MEHDITSATKFIRSLAATWRRRDVRLLRVWIVSFIGLAVVTLAMLAVRPDLDKAHVALLYVLVVLVGSAGGGRILGLCLVGCAFLLFNYLFLPPYHTLVIADPLDWLVLVTFIVTSVVAAQLLTRAQQRTAEARARTTEVERLSALGAETLNAIRPEDALTAIAEVIRSTLVVETCDLYVASIQPGGLQIATHVAKGVVDPGGLAIGEPHAERHPGTEGHTLVEWSLESGNVSVERLDGTLGVIVGREAREGHPATVIPWHDVGNARAITIPLRVRERIVGVLRISSDSGIDLAPDQREFLNALSYYAALGVERMRLAAEASHTEAFREADRLKNALLAAVSHDLRTPLTTMKALAHDIAERGAASGDVRAVSIEEEADRLTALVSDLLDLSRLTGRAIQFRPEVNAADDLIGAALARARSVLVRRDVRVIADRTQPALLGIFDFVHTLRALVNLVENAAKYSPATEPIELTVSRDGARLVIAVADRGKGVSKADAERIFEPFYRPPGVPADVPGAGLGLAITRALALAQGGDVTYARRPGGGSVFLLSVPAVTEPLTAPE